MLKNSFQKGSVQISTFAGMAIIAAVVVVASTIAVIKYREMPQAIVPIAVITPKFTPTPTPLVATSTPNLIIDEKTASWQTYKSEKYGFEVKYPKNFYIKENYLSASYQIINNEINSIITLSDNTKFEKEESAILFSIENMDEYNETVKQYVNDETAQATAKKLELDLLKKSLNTEIISTFKGNPPWGYSLVYVKIPNAQNKGLLITIRIYQADDPGYGGSNRDLNLSKQILSTFKFTGNNEAAGFVEKNTIAMNALKNAEYTINVNGGAKKIKLQNGSYSEKSANGNIDVNITENQIGFGSIGNNKTQYAAVILNVSQTVKYKEAAPDSLGDVFHYWKLVVLEDKNGIPVYVDDITIGDKEKINSISMESGKITINMLTFGPNDALCCPSKSVKVQYLLLNNKLEIF